MKKIKKGLKFAGGLFAAYLVLQGIRAEFFPEKINTREDLIRIVQEEEPKARKNNRAIHIYWMYGSTEWGTAISGKIAENTYKVVLDDCKDRTTIRHELYHIYAGHCDRAYEKGEWTLKDRIKDEITATIYANYGWRF